VSVSSSTSPRCGSLSTPKSLTECWAAAERERLSALEVIDRLLGEQAARRRERFIERRIQAAHFAERKTLESFDWKFNKTIHRAQYEQLATGEFVRRRVNVVLVGHSGVGKSHLMQAVGLSACALGYRVFYTTSARMLIQLTAALADKSLNETLKQYAKWDLLIMDELGFDRIEREECPQAAHLLYKVIDARHQKGSTIVITNVDFDAWGAYLGDAPLAMAMLDRSVDGAVVLKIKGPSYRASRAGRPAD
jgi:DNA replication protein DnaC